MAHLRSFGVFGRLARDWWREPVDYTSHVQYFSKRSISSAVQALIGIGTALDAVVSACVLLPSATTSASRSAVAVFVALQIFWAWVWCRCLWPPRWASITFVVSADIAITVIAVLDASWVLSSFGLGFFALLSVYLIFFDGPKMLLTHTIWILITTAVVAVRISTRAGLEVVGFTTQTLLAVALLMGSPLGIQAAIWALRNDANESFTDPLTGLLNRRGLHQQFAHLVHDAALAESEVTVMVVDLDRFKMINDRFGHTVGDAVLVRTARDLKSVVRGSALVARVGGEEFVIVDVHVGRQTNHDLDRVRQAIAAHTSYSVTASVGITELPSTTSPSTTSDIAAVLDATIERADRAMFTAKRDGGNATVLL